MAKSTFVAAVAVFAWSQERLSAQTLPQSYGSYYGQQARLRPNANVNEYLYDKYFYRQPSVSPYLNLGRRGTGVGDSYTSWVRPEQERRAHAESSLRSYVQQRKMAGNVGHTVYSNALGQTTPRTVSPQAPRPTAPNPYYNQWYRQR